MRRSRGLKSGSGYIGPIQPPSCKPLEMEKRLELESPYRNIGIKTWIDWVEAICFDVPWRGRMSFVGDRGLWSPGCV